MSPRHLQNAERRWRRPDIFTAMKAESLLHRGDDDSAQTQSAYGSLIPLFEPDITTGTQTARAASTRNPLHQK